jgi:hypothetical protein
MQSKIKKTAIAICYLILVGVAVYALSEWGYPSSNYSPGPRGPISQLLSLGLILGTGIPMLLYLWKRKPSQKSVKIITAIFLTSTILLVVLLTPNALASAERRAKVQWYVNDLQSQGFTVVDAGQYYYRHGGGATQLTSYAEVAATAKSINCSTIYFRSGTPWNFIFFMGDGLQMVFPKPQVPGPFLPGEYLYYAPYDPINGISLPK